MGIDAWVLFTTLNLEVNVSPKADSKKSLVTLLITPLGKDAEIWKKLREIGSKIGQETK